MTTQASPSPDLADELLAGFSAMSGQDDASVPSTHPHRPRPYIEGI